MKHIIWSDRYDEIDQIADDLKTEPDFQDYSESELYDIAVDLNCQYLDDERTNLNVKVPTEIVALGDIGLWNRRVRGYKLVGDRISDCLYSSATETTWYCDKYNFKAIEHHHDGSNYVTYRERRTNISESSWDHFLTKLYYGTASDRDIRRYTISLNPRIRKVYGF